MKEAVCNSYVRKALTKTTELKDLKGRPLAENSLLLYNEKLRAEEAVILIYIPARARGSHRLKVTSPMMNNNMPCHAMPRQMGFYTKTLYLLL